MHFWKPVKENSVVLQMSTEDLPNAVVTMEESHCCGNKPLPWFPSKLRFCVQMHRNCGMDAVGGEAETAGQPAVTTVSDASRGYDVSVAPKGSFRCDLHKVAVHSHTCCTQWIEKGEQCNYQQKTCQDGRFIRWKRRQCTYSQGRDRSVSCCLKIGQRGAQNGEIISIWENRTRDSLRMVQRKLIGALPPRPRW